MKETTFGAMWLDSAHFCGVQDGFLVIFNDIDGAAAKVYPTHVHQVIVGQ
jgi:hypothetical protein